MTIYNWSALTNGQTVRFNPAFDVLHFDDAAISAASVGFNFLPTPVDAINGILSIGIGTKSVTLGVPVTRPAPLAALTTTNLTFANGSLFIIGDNTIGTAGDNFSNLLTGGDGNDELIGLGGNDTLLGGAGNDAFTLFYGTPVFENDSIDGGAGSDGLIYYGSSATAASVNLSNATVRGVAAHTAISAQGTASLTSIEAVLGTTGNDLLIGGDPAHDVDSFGNRISELFRGNAGDDTIVGGSGLGFGTFADYANNSALQAVTANFATGVVSDGLGGTDTLVDVDGLYGGAGNDVLRGGSLNRASTGVFSEIFRGNAGNDTLDGANATSGGAVGSSDRADYSNNSALQSINVNLGLGTAQDGWGGVDTLIDIDSVGGGAGNDTLVGSAGSDGFDGGAGNDTLDGASGSDAANFGQSTAGVIVNLSASAIRINGITVAAGTANDGMGGTDTLIRIENVSGSRFADYIRGGDNFSDLAPTFLSGGGGDDTIDGGAGVDFASYSNVPLVLGGVNATISNESGTVNDKTGGTDTLIGIEGLSGTHANDTLTGGLGIQWFRGNGGNDVINGGDDNDWVSYAGDPIGVTINLTTGTATDGGNGVGGLLGLGGTDTLISIENAEGSNHSDRITGSAALNFIDALAGNDTVVGAGGNDLITGGSGNDWLEGETGNDPLPAGQIAGNDTLFGENGDDTILAGAGDDWLSGGSGTDFLIGELGNDFVYGDSDWDAIDGRQGNDTMYGDGGNDIVFGDGYFYWFGFGDDVLRGGEGNDIMMGEAGESSVAGGADTLYGELGDDLLDGCGGNDIIYGGDGNDVIDGDHGNDYILGGQGAEIMLGSNAVAYGGPTQGSDLFVYHAMSDGGDSIYGFDTRAGENDGIDLRPLFDALGYAGSSPHADGYLYVFQNRSNTDIYIDSDGAVGGVNLTRMVTLVDTVASGITDSFFLFQ